MKAHNIVILSLPLIPLPTIPISIFHFLSSEMEGHILRMYIKMFETNFCRLGRFACICRMETGKRGLSDGKFRILLWQHQRPNIRTLHEWLLKFILSPQSPCWHPPINKLVNWCGAGCTWGFFHYLVPDKKCVNYKTVTHWKNIFKYE